MELGEINREVTSQDWSPNEYLVKATTTDRRQWQWRGDKQRGVTSQDWSPNDYSVKATMNWLSSMSMEGRWIIDSGHQMIIRSKSRSMYNPNRVQPIAIPN